MNKDRVKGKTNEVVGETRARAGRAIGSDRIESEGETQAAKGKTRSAVGKLKETAGDVKEKAKKAVQG
jgi:uncharacterized protein YjbJ (UPF0337 family)